MYFKFASVVLFALATNGFAIPAPTARTVETSLRSAVEPEISTQIQTQGANNVLPTGRLRDQTFPKGLDLIGNTPVCDITAVCKPKNPKTRILGKCEMFNPGYSMKDRIVKHIFTEAENSGKLKKGMTVVAASSGNTGCSVAMMCALKGYDCVIITNSKCSEEKCASIRAYGAKLLISEPGQDYMQMELDLADENPTWFSVNQYNNLDNPGAHFASTGPEIWEQTHGLVTDFVAAGSTGGTVSGTGGFLKSMNPNVKIHLADPNGSIFAHYKETGEVKKGKEFLVEGVGKNNIPGAMNFDVIDDTIVVNDTESFAMCKKIARRTGLFVGGSSGLNVYAAAKIAEESDEELLIVTMLCDLGVKYLSKVYNDEYLKEKDVFSDDE